MTDFKLTQEDAPRAQGTLFEGIGSGKAESELLRRGAALAGLATVDDLLAWTDGDQVQGICSTCGAVQPMPADMIVHLHDLGRDLPNNVAVTRIDVSPPLASPGDAVRVSATVLNAGLLTATIAML